MVLMGGRVSGYASIGNVAARRRDIFRGAVPTWRTWFSKAAATKPYGVRGLIYGSWPFLITVVTGTDSNNLWFVAFLGNCGN